MIEKEIVNELHSLKPRVGRPKKFLVPKHRFTLYLLEEVYKKLNKMYSLEVIAGTRETKSNLISIAIERMHDDVFCKSHNNIDKPTECRTLSPNSAHLFEV